ncbi:MAG: hypothetical protein ACI87W_001869 [Halieaceae bacterium]|jgi:hypothetical protein
MRRGCTSHRAMREMGTDHGFVNRESKSTSSPFIPEDHWYIDARECRNEFHTTNTNDVIHRDRRTRRVGLVLDGPVTPGRAGRMSKVSISGKG